MTNRRDRTLLRILRNGLRPLEQAIRPFVRILRRGVKRLQQPIKLTSFDEEFYRAFYKDVDDAIEAGRVSTGKSHFLDRGWREGRLARYDRTAVLEKRLPRITEPKHFSIAKEIERRLQPIAIEVDADARPTFWALLPNLNPDIVFGGYIAFFEFLVRAKEYLSARGFAIELLVTNESEVNAKYFRWHPSTWKYRSSLADLGMRSLHAQAMPMTIGAHDIVIAYSAWDAYPAAQMVERTKNSKFLQFVQEYEAIFHDHSALHAVCAGGFDMDCFPIFNSRLLKNYFESRRLGVFRNRAVTDGDYFVFEHAISAPEPAIHRRAHKTMLLYARPEAHAARNLYEFLEIALRRLCAKGAFGPEWSFIGIGPLTALPPRDLGRGHHLIFHEKMPPEKYKAIMQTIDVGVSLMYAPHPGVVPYEMAAAGALVVTNTFDNRDANYFASISRNIIPCEPRLDDVERAIAEAIERVDDLESRRQNVYRPKSISWSEIFDETALERIFRHFL